MVEKALGLIEVRGFLGAVVVADAALKAANVSLLNVETVKSGLNTVQLVGDVSAVRSAVEAAVEIAQDQPYYLHSHVIARLDSQTDSILNPIRKEENKEVPKVESVSLEESVLESLDPVEEAEVITEPLQSAIEEVIVEDIVSDVEETIVEGIVSDIVTEEEISTEGKQKYSEEELNKFKVVELRSIAYRENKINLSKKEIKFANKQLLIQALLKLKS
jgi:ethanolamine utilization protein, putative